MVYPHFRWNKSKLILHLRVKVIPHPLAIKRRSYGKGVIADQQSPIGYTS
jgi:hypothetical protein